MKQCKLYAIYKLNYGRETFIDVISAKDIGIAAKWAINTKGYDKGYNIKHISLKNLRQRKKLLKKELFTISTKIANISRYI